MSLNYLNILHQLYKTIHLALLCYSFINTTTVQTRQTKATLSLDFSTYSHKERFY